MDIDARPSENKLIIYGAKTREVIPLTAFKTTRHATPDTWRSLAVLICAGALPWSSALLLMHFLRFP